MATKIVNSLQSTAANMFALYKQTHVAHINVIGPTFIQDHEFLGELYELFNDSFDSIAELIRINMGNLPADFEEASIIPGVTEFNSEKIYKYLDINMSVVLSSLYASHKIASNLGLIGTFTELENIISSVEKNRWKVRSFI